MKRKVTQAQIESIRYIMQYLSDNVGTERTSRQRRSLSIKVDKHFVWVSASLGYILGQHTVLGCLSDDYYAFQVNRGGKIIMRMVPDSLQQFNGRTYLNFHVDDSRLARVSKTEYKLMPIFTAMAAFPNATPAEIFEKVKMQMSEYTDRGLKSQISKAFKKRGMN